MRNADDKTKPQGKIADFIPISIRNPQSAIRNHKQHGLTLVELMVTLAVLMVVLGLALGLMVESDHASREMLRLEAAMQYCQQAMDEAVRLVRAAVPPAAMQGTVSPGLLTPRYSRKELALVVAEGGGFSRVMLDSVDLEKSQAAIRRRAITLGHGAVTTQTAELSRISRPERFEPRIRFGYAATPAPGQTVNYLDEWTSATPPALVRITIQARIGNRTAHSGNIELQTAIIPGLIPAGTAVQETAAMTAAPAPAKRTASKGQGAASSRVLEAMSASAAAQPVMKSDEKGKPLKVITAEPPVRVISRTKLDKLKEGTGR